MKDLAFVKEQIRDINSTLSTLNDVLEEDDFKLRVTIAESEGQVSLSNDVLHYLYTSEKPDVNLAAEQLANSLANYAIISGVTIEDDIDKVTDDLNYSNIEIVEDIVYQKAYMDEYKMYEKFGYFKEED